MAKFRKTTILIVLICALLVVGYGRLDDSKKRFLRELARQIPYLIPRYFV